MIDEKKLIEDIEKEIEFAMKCNMPAMVAGMRQIASVIEEQPKIGEWILCSEQLPEVPEGTDDDECPEFNVMIKGANRATTLRCASDGTWFDEFGYVYPVIYWKPLPEPCKGGKNHD